MDWVSVAANESSLSERNESLSEAEREPFLLLILFLNFFIPLGKARFRWATRSKL